MEYALLVSPDAASDGRAVISSTDLLLPFPEFTPKLVAGANVALSADSRVSTALDNSAWCKLSVPLNSVPNGKVRCRITRGEGWHKFDICTTDKMSSFISGSGYIEGMYQWRPTSGDFHNDGVLDKVIDSLLSSTDGSTCSAD